jgi:asparagine synthase (glutamine-hydrolysing)
MFAFAIFDARLSMPSLFLARDRLGIKPLYYACTSEAFLFASELKGVLASGLVSDEISSAGLVGYLMLGSVPNPLTIYQSVHALKPGCTLLITLGTRLAVPIPKRYWSLPTEVIDPVNKVDAVEQVQALLEEAVRIRLVSDVPLGAFLSGGLDSSAVVALMRQATQGSIRTCSMIFEEAGYSEAPYAREMAKSVEAQHYERVVTAQDVERELERILWAMDQPTVDGVNTYFVSQTAREAGLTVSLSGLGGDELFGGYPNTFQGVPQTLQALSLAQAVPGGAALTRFGINLLPTRYRWAKILDALNRPRTPASAYLARRGLFSPAEVRALVQGDIWEEAQKSFEPLEHIATASGNHAAAPSLFSWISRAELSTYTHHQLLRDTDVMSMAHSLEVRVPLLDHRLVEMVLRLPEAIKAKGDQPKALLARAVHHLLPERVRNRTDQQGFVIPFNNWLRGPLRKKVQPSSSRSSDVGWLRPGAVEKIWQDYEAGRQHWSRPWALAALDGWHSISRAKGA